MEFMKSLKDDTTVFYLLFLAFVLCSNLTLMNMLIGILCDVVSGVSNDAKEEVFLKEVELQIGRLALELDLDQNGSISKTEFVQLINDPLMTHTFDALGVDIVGLSNF